MAPQEVTPREALMRLGASTAAAVAQVLEMFAPGAVERGDVSVLPDGGNPFANMPFGAVATGVSYVNGVTGGNVFVMAPAGARALAAAMGVPAPEPGPGGEIPEDLSELELSAVAEAANQTMAAAASAISLVIGQEIEISPPDTKILRDQGEAVDAFGKAPHSASTTFLVSGEPCRLIQLVPSAFVQRMVRAIDELAMEDAVRPEHRGGSGARGDRGGADQMELQDALSGIRLRMWAELGRARLPLGQALALPLGAVVDLDHPSDSPVDLFVNGVRFGQGHLLVTDDGEWAVCIDELGSHAPPQEQFVVTAGASTEPQRKGASD
jgi:flagellar motor switch protein FliN/FliY